MIEVDFLSLVPIGTITKSVGYKWAVRIEVYPGFEATWSTLTKCLIKVQGIWAPFFVKSSSIRSDSIEIIFEDVVEPEDIKNILHQEIFIRPEDRSPEDDPEDDEQADEWISFTITDTVEGRIGDIESIEELPGQVLALVTYQGRSIPIPLADDLILDIDLEKKTILMNLPSGILDL